MSDPRGADSAIISLVNVAKAFGPTRALDGLDLRVEPGDVHGFLGPNGAGKTVTIRVLLGLLRADSGVARLFGADPWADAVELHRRLAYVPGDVNLWPGLSGGEIIDLLGRLRGGIDHRRRDELIARFALDPRKKSRTYSKGNRQKVALIAALSSRVDLLLLDEPTSGLDPLMESVFQSCILEATADGTTVLLSSHILAEVEALCDRVTIIRQGRAVQHGTLDELRSLTRTSIDVRTRVPLTDFDTRAGVHRVRVDDDRLRFDVDGSAIDEVMRQLGEAGVVSLVSQPPTLEELFLMHYSDSNGQDTTATP
ncbi:ATP-binding cassette domain-containing protein [Ilumatobacter sp.]|jgi:ABC-2 type transport system ATP-binding protein|uniref:ABC transporter ATP-binding protein n=1 Tax=Ilumatobacter sp. TaxID=1967498 RepID=UPI002A2E0655|nr:ABC transporter ATP-binding protein [Ilumatobacter sp.]MDG0975002.1 ABC transporter ATP-binding protein [Ilumatobacter sp.]MDG1392479.1 ABC transporter ATP-binding protein [Ilumatobacter sp.]MDG1785878.1 ABC transporter ATP-binding protein [Ilumatobacter sp.]